MYTISNGPAALGPPLPSLQTTSPLVPSPKRRPPPLHALKTADDTKSPVVGDFQDLTLDEDARFSPVPLTATASKTPVSRRRIGTMALAGADLLGLQSPGSATTVVVPEEPSGDKGDGITSPSITNVPFLIARLDQQDADGRRGSADGANLLQEEFNRMLQAQENKESDETTIDWDFWGEVMADYQAFARDNSESLARAIESGIPSALRGMIWQLMCASKDPELESVYAKFLKEPSPHEKAISRDLGRTFPHHDFFMDGQGIGQENLFNVLKAYSLYDPQVGYCQGLPFVVAVLLLNMPDEEAFCVLVRLMQSYDLRGHFLPEMPALQLRLFQFDRLVEELLPVLHVHFLRQGINYRFQLPIVFRIYDNVLATGIEAIFSFSIVLLQKSEETLLNLKFDEILSFLKNRLFEPYTLATNTGKDDVIDVDRFVQDAFHVKITPFMLDSYSHEYTDLLHAREAHAVEMDNLRNANRSLAAKVKTLEQSLAQLNEEHCEMVKELIMARISNEEMEGELVRYKLLYADLMHQNEDALSSHRLSTASRRY